MPYFGNGKISGVTRIEGVNAPNIPVELLDRADGAIRDKTESDAGGNFVFNELSLTRVYDVIARPPGKNAVISDSRKPVVGGERPDFDDYVVSLGAIRHIKMSDVIGSTVAKDSIHSVNASYAGNCQLGGGSLLPMVSTSGCITVSGGGRIIVPGGQAAQPLVGETYVFTLSPSSYSENMAIFHKGDNWQGSGQGTCFIILPNKKVQIQYFNNAWLQTESNVVDFPETFMFAIRFNTSTLIDIFVNGVKVHSYYLSSGVLSPNVQMQIGAQITFSNPGNTFSGRIGDFMQFPSLLPDEEISSLYRLGFE